MEIDAGKRSIAEIITQGQHIVPRYQRQYAWTEQNIRDFWADLIRSPKSPHFMGSMVSCAAGDSIRELVDGQQRLTTCLIALAVTRDCYHEFQLHNRATGVEQYLEFIDKNGEGQYRITIKSDAENAKLKSVISRASDRIATTQAPPPSLQQAAYRLLSENLHEYIRAKGNPEQAIDEFRDALLAALVVYIRVPDRNNAFTIFETLNDRGKSLTPIDLIKNLVISKIPSTALADDEKAWADSISAIESTELEGLTPDAFVTYFWNSRNLNDPTESIETSRVRRSVAEALSAPAGIPEDERKEAEAQLARELISELREATRTLEALGATLQSCGSAEGWSDFPRYRRDKYEKICDPLYGILVTKSLQPMPLLLALFKKYHTGTILTNKTLVDFLKVIEQFQFRWSISQRPSTSTNRRLFRRTSHAIASATNRAELAEALHEFHAQARLITPSDNQFRDGLDRLEYSNSAKKDVHRIRYILMRLERHWGSTKLDLTRQPSIEHIEDQGGRSTATRRNFWIFKLGNLTLLPPDINSSLPKDFAQKSRELKHFVNPSDHALHNAIESSTWNNSEYYNARREALLSDCCSVWNRELRID